MSIMKNIVATIISKSGLFCPSRLSHPPAKDIDHVPRLPGTIVSENPTAASIPITKKTAPSNRRRVSKMSLLAEKPRMKISDPSVIRTNNA
jgi:hypothetical protein